MKKIRDQQFTTHRSRPRIQGELADARKNREERVSTFDTSEPLDKTDLVSRRAARRRGQGRNEMMLGTAALLIVTGTLALTGKFNDATPTDVNKLPKKDVVEYVVPNTESPLTLANQVANPQTDPLTVSEEIEAQVGKEANAGEVVKFDKHQVDLPPPAK